ncbi:hemerythrin domain-containing protein [Sphaerisporangium fuscum]|uniref:hemerythrin domain-containing protein n=1 Tax=Sphaerisporangium fuscum TaxID=2835868 RepID=UPI001BDC76C5|nr:hemerythrin domain-containing protein [Sphaerisporangium fuscum]
MTDQAHATTTAAAEHSRLTAFGDHLIALHDELRRDIAALREEASHLPADGETAGPLTLPQRLHSHCLSFCEALDAHHTTEDRTVFPFLAQEHPELSEVLDRLTSDHRVMATLLTDLREVAATPSAPGFHADLERLSVELLTHLDREEHYLVPVLNAVTHSPTTETPLVRHAPAALGGQIPQAGAGSREMGDVRLFRERSMRTSDDGPAKFTCGAGARPPRDRLKDHAETRGPTATARVKAAFDRGSG